MFSKIREFLFFIYTHINQVSAQLKTTASDLFYDSLIKIKIRNKSSVLAKVTFTATSKHLYSRISP